MAKHNKGNKTPVAQNANTAQSAVAPAWQKATAGIGSLASLVQGDASAVALPDLEKDQVSELDKVEPEKKIELERLLADISDAAKRIRDLHEDAQKRTDDLARKEEALSLIHISLSANAFIIRSEWVAIYTLKLGKCDLARFRRANRVSYCQLRCR